MLFLPTLLLAALTAAHPMTFQPRAPYEICPAFDTPLCCQLDAGGMVGTTCQSPSSAPSNKTEFLNDCHAIGFTAECCKLPTGGDAMFCQPP
ncbi:hypothetical protein M409DRAFT_26813 [Zasmidium cellare ATCC 36951]|uniref:Hydrophobin n=1 Tax=Zasmidium cellare ATCC 36951 TaxID=1080233 RepID=A0A6A6C7D6_ZASCE|nr:uncharacterized protein M409DRAFT_26813 [Zasmidium cellare ATCC 36951]KAF2162961.1 hypothetical protein M409DRAFT_26813 [Zasmidium cellare ATCC 36951]